MNKLKARLEEKDGQLYAVVSNEVIIESLEGIAERLGRAECQERELAYLRTVTIALLEQHHDGKVTVDLINVQRYANKELSSTLDPSKPTLILQTHEKEEEL